MTFFYDLNKRLAGLASTQLNEGKEKKADKDYDGDGKIESPKDEYQGSRIAAAKKAGKLEEKSTGDYSAKKARAGKDIGKPGKAFAQIAKDAAERYGSKEKGEKVAGAVLAKLRKEDVNEEELDEGFKEMDAWLEKRKKDAGTGKFDKKKISTGTVYTRRAEEEPEDEEDEAGEKKKGRKSVGAGKGKKIGAKVKGTSKLHSKGAIKEGTTHDLVTAAGILGNLVGRSSKGETIDPKELATQLRQVHSLLSRIMGGAPVDTLRPETKPVAEVAPPGAKAERMVKHIKKSLSKDGDLSDKDKAIAYATTWKAHKEGKVEEESTDTRDDRAEKAGKKVAKDIEYDEGHKGKDDNRAEKAGKKVTKDIEYDEKVKEEAPKKSKGGIEFGKGVYESINSKVENMIAEGMSVNVSMSTDDQGKPTKSINVSAEGEQAETLAQLLNLAGLQSKEAGCGCGQTPCGCDQVDEAYGDTTPTENKPDYPTDEETTGEDDELLRRWAGGLNKPKSTGQTTIPVIASQTSRQVSEESEADKLGMNLYAELKSFKAK